MANTTIPVITAQSATITAASAAALDTAVKAQVNTLVQSYVDPKNTGATPGNTVNGTITISPTGTVITAENVVTWYATVQWQGWLIPS